MFQYRSVIEDLRHLAMQWKSFGTILENDAFRFEPFNDQFRRMFYEKKDTDVELVKVFFSS
jgi:hypothetical protein